MRLAIIGDIHSNIFALESVIEDINKRNIDKIISTGDLVGYLPFPNEVIDLVKKNEILSIQGNHDLKIADSKKIDEFTINKMKTAEIHKSASKAYTNWKITDENRIYLKNLPKSLSIKCCNLNILIVHGSPNKIDEYMYKGSKKIIDLSKKINDDILISGHTHLPYHEQYNNKHFINPGSVGKPKGGSSRACYMILDIIKSDVKTEIIKVNYNLEGIINSIKDNHMIPDKLINNLKKGC